jgi:ribonuclease HepT-like protein
VIRPVLTQSGPRTRSRVRDPDHLGGRAAGPDDWLADFPTEPWEQIKGIGNRIRHEYFRIDDAILWQVITTDTHALKTVMESMLAGHAAEGSP